MRISDMKISSRLAAAFGLVLLMTVASAGFSIYKMASIQADFEDTVLDKNAKIKLNNDMANAVHVVSRVMRSMILVDDKALKDGEKDKLEKSRASYDHAAQQLEKLPWSEAGKAAFAKIQAARDAARPLNNKVIELAMADKDDEARDLLLKEANPVTLKWLEAIEENVDRQEKRNEENFVKSQADYQTAKTTLIAVSVLAIGLAVAAAWLVTRSITSQLGAEPGVAVKLAQDVAQGDLSTPIDLREGDHQSMMAQFMAMQKSLASVVNTVRQNADSVATASAQIAQGNTDLSQRTEEQASALQQTAASMEQLGSTVTSNADNAKQANQLAAGASQVAVQGGAVVQQVVETMKGINQSSKKIADIIGVIDGIAFQTNILALNAAVEAARAGEQGRGFAVVAGEVRNLAQRSADAAKEIKSLITASVEQVDKGSSLVDQAGETMKEVVQAIGRVSDIMGEISAASVQQSAGVQQVGEAVGQMDQTTQQNAALVEESAAAAESLRQQALQLVQAVSVFRISSMGSVGHDLHADPAPVAAKAVKSAPRFAAKPAKAARPAKSGTAPAAEPAHATAKAGEDWESF